MQFHPSSGRVDTAVWMHHLDAIKTAQKEELHKNVASNIDQVLAVTPHKAPTVRKLSKLDEPDK